MQKDLGTNVTGIDEKMKAEARAITMSVKDAALAKVKEAKVEEATKKLVSLYSQLDDAKKIVRNIEREIDDYILTLES